MADKFELNLLLECIKQVSAAIGDDESIIQLKKGRTRPGRQVFHFYKADIATLDRNLTELPKFRRTLIVTMNQDSPGSATIEPARWEPWDHCYDD
jgi:hypothetical protein